MLKVSQRVVVTEVRNYERVFQTKEDLVTFLEVNLPSGVDYPEPLAEMSEKELAIAYRLHCTFMPLDRMNLYPKYTQCDVSERQPVEVEYLPGLDIQWRSTAMLYCHGKDCDIKGAQHLAKIYMGKTEIRLEIVYSDDLRVKRSAHIIRNPRNVHMQDLWFSIDADDCRTMTLEQMKAALETELLRSV